jgi:DNA-binding beta-propeller fold protein YncE
MSDTPVFVQSLVNPQGLVVDNNGTYMYVTCINNSISIAQINMSNGLINTYFSYNLQGSNRGLAIDSTGTYMYFVTSFGIIAKIQVSTGEIISTWTIPFPSGTISSAYGIVIDNTETYVYVTFNTGSNGNGNIAQIEISTGTINTNWLQNTNSSFTYPTSLVIDSSGTYMYVCYYNVNVINSTTTSTATSTGYIAQINMSNGTINNGSWFTLQNSNLFGLAIDNTGTYMYVTNYGLSTINQINISTASISVLNWVTEPSGSYPGFLTIYNNNLYVSNEGNNIGNICEFQLTNTSSTVNVGTSYKGDSCYNVGTSYKGESCYNFATPYGLYCIQFRFAQKKNNTVTNYINIFKLVAGFIIFTNYVEIDVNIQNKKINELIQQNTFLNLKNNTNAKYITKFYKKVSHAILKTLPKSKRGFCMLEPIQKAP